MYCHNCGAENEATAKFCANCGTTLSANPPVEGPVSAQPQPPVPPYQTPPSYQPPPNYQAPNYQQTYQPQQTITTGNSMAKNLGIGCLIAVAIVFFVGLSCMRACFGLHHVIRHY